MRSLTPPRSVTTPQLELAEVMVGPLTCIIVLIFMVVVAYLCTAFLKHVPETMYVCYARVCVWRGYSRVCAGPDLWHSLVS